MQHATQTYANNSESSDINSVLAGATCDYGVQTSNVTLFRSANALPHVLVDCAHCVADVCTISGYGTCYGLWEQPWRVCGGNAV